MAADPNKAAEALAGQTYADAATRNDASKKALLDQIATTGTYQDKANAVAQAQAAAPALPTESSLAAINPIAGQDASQVSQFGQATLAAATALAAHQRQQQADAANTYFNGMAAAIPLEQSRSQSNAAGIYGDLIAQREAQAAAKQQAAIQLEIEKAQLAQVQARTAAAGANGTPLTVTQKAALAHDTLQGLMTSKLIHTDPITGKQSLTPAGEVVQIATTDPSADLASLFKQYGVQGVDQQTVVDTLNHYTSALGSQGYYGTGAAPSYTVPDGGSRFAGATASGSAKPKAKAAPKSKAKAQSASNVAGADTAVFDQHGHLVGHMDSNGNPVPGLNGFNADGNKVIDGYIYVGR